MRGNRFTAMSHEKFVRGDERLEHDEYETPANVTELLLQHVKFTGPVLEPAAGSGRIAKVLESKGLYVEQRDLHTGQDYLDFHDTWYGDTITNPPYHKGMADMFVARALATTKGKVAMLLQAGFMFGTTRADELWRHFPPETIIVVPWRIKFYIGGTDKTIRSQAYNHCWFVWDNQRVARAQPSFILPY